MILAILPDISKAETLLNNLAEADFDLKDVSVVTKDPGLRDKIAKDLGPLKGVEAVRLIDALVKAGFSNSGAKSCHVALMDGRVVIAMEIKEEYRQAAQEMFQDQSAQIIKE